MNRERSALQKRLFDIVFGTDSTAGRNFDIALILVIVASVIVVMLDSIASFHERHGELLWRIEWGFTLLFTAEYLLRIWIARNRGAYVRSVYGIIDLMALLPSYLALLLPQTAPLLVIRLIRVLRIFRVLRLLAYLREANELAGAMRRSRRQIIVFFSMVVTIMVVFGCLMYVIEGPENGFDNIPISVYWAIVTITTVGYGDITPITTAGRTISAISMLLGYAIIAVPTGIYTSNLVYERTRSDSPLNCPQCARAGHQNDAAYCRICGTALSTNDE